MQQRNLWAAESSLRELGSVSLEDALAYLDLLAEQKPEKVERAAVGGMAGSKRKPRSSRWRSRSSRSQRWQASARGNAKRFRYSDNCSGAFDL
jgi:hypothetical protein